MLLIYNLEVEMQKKENINEKWARPLSEVLKVEISRRRKKDPDFRQNRFAEELGISPSTLTQLLNENRNPSLDLAFSIAQALDCSIDYLVGLSDVKKRSWNEYSKSKELISKQTGLLNSAIDRLVKLKEDEDFAYVINSLILSDTRLMNLIADYLNFLPTNENAIYAYDAGKKKKYHFVNNTYVPVDQEYFTNNDIESVKISRILDAFKEFKKHGYKTYIANKERLALCEILVSGIKDGVRFEEDESDESINYEAWEQELRDSINRYKEEIALFEKNMYKETGEE